ncbi:MAG: HlyD family type I secretion periplasmic adaptor subunit [Hyphomicrobium sp.]|uniref:HlyD family type I secretion periplasmic adaptor subunit n=1 Tax=Hyphomicrobium sp. TaxID=82 RepID=UPI003D13881A
MVNATPKSSRSIRRNIWAGIAVAALLVGGVGAWATTTEISGAVIAPGALVVDSNLRKVQHPTGGVIGEIHVRDGDRVKTGDVLLRLDATITRANLAIVVKTLDELRARKARLEAERDNLETVAFPAELEERQSDHDVARIMSGERKLFDLRRDARTGQKAQLRQRIGQLHREVEGLDAQTATKAKEIVLIQKELAGARDLWDQNLYPITKLTSLERETTRVEGEHAQLISSVAQVQGRISETELQIVQIDRDLGSEVAKELRETDARIGEALERKIAAEDQLNRVDIRAPIGGIVHKSTAHTVGGVIGASAESIMLIVPESDDLTIEAKVAPQDIDQIHVGQPTSVRFLAFNQRTTPQVPGTVTRISADAVTDERTGVSFYTIRIGLDRAALEMLGDVRPLPGMPVEAFVSTGERKVISYLMKPLAEQFERALRER